MEGNLRFFLTVALVGDNAVTFVSSNGGAS